MPGLGSNISQKVLAKDAQLEPLTKIKELEWEVEKPDPTAKYGKNIGIIGQPHAGKTNLALLHAFFNSKYIPYMKEAGLHDVVELLKSGILAEIEKIVVVESENNLRKALNDGVEKALYKPLLPILDIIPVKIPRKEVALRGGKLVNINREIIQQAIEKYKDVVKGLVDDEGEGTLLIMDSTTKFKKLLDDKLGNVVEVAEKRSQATMEGLDKYTQIFYAFRNTEWENLLEYVRGFKGWNIDTFKESKTPQQYVDLGSAELSTKWVTGTEHFLDIIWRITRLPDDSRRVEIADGKSRYMPSKEELLKPFNIPLKSRMGAMPLISRMCEKLLLGESQDDNQFW
jgi:hypothetical protein